jgi:hypothetical protein
MKPLAKVEFVKPIKLESLFLSIRGKEGKFVMFKEQS